MEMFSREFETALILAVIYKHCLFAFTETLKFIILVTEIIWRALLLE